MRLKKGDKVRVLSGRDRNKEGAIVKVLRDEGRVTVEGVNIFSKRSRPKRQGQKGETVMVPRPLQASKVMLICKSCGKPSRIGIRREEGHAVRVCKRCSATI